MNMLELNSSGKYLNTTCLKWSRPHVWEHIPLLLNQYSFNELQKGKAILLKKYWNEMIYRSVG